MDPLFKKLGQIELEHQPDPRQLITHHRSEPVTHQDLKQDFEDHVKGGGKPLHAVEHLEEPGLASPKVVFKTDKGNTFLVKPHSEKDTPLSGWAEASSQHLYNAAGLGHLHQKSFVSQYDSSKHETENHIPATVIHIEKAKPVHSVNKAEVLVKRPVAAHEARQIGIMDFLTSNQDRNSGNLMIRPDGTPLAIDHGRSFGYYGDPNEPDSYIPSKRQGTWMRRYLSRAPSHLTYEPNKEQPLLPSRDDEGHHGTVKSWWPGVAPDVARAFQERLQLVHDPVQRRHLEMGFNARKTFLDNLAKRDLNGFRSELKKSIEQGDEPVVGNPEKAPKHSKEIHQAMKAAMPSHVADHAKFFEQYVNHPDNPVKPVKTSLNGIEKKSLIQLGHKTYLAKPAHGYKDHRSGFNEMTSQAMAQAAGIGHLHQQSHATHLNIVENGKKTTQPAIIVHYRPEPHKTYEDLSNEKPGQGLSFDQIRADHSADLRKLLLHDVLTNNNDRHEGNLMFSNTGVPQAIDHGNSFAYDHDPDSTFSPHDQKYLVHDNIIHSRLGLNLDDETHGWWKSIKPNVVAAYNKQIDMIPDKDERSARRNNFNTRVKAIDSKSPSLFPQAAPLTLKKSLGDAEFLHEQHTAFPEHKGFEANTKGLHEQLMNAHPSAIHPQVAKFNTHVNHPLNIKQPVVSQKPILGLQKKATYEHEGTHFMTKPAHEPSTALGAWNELTSQAMYHAGGIGHLHQKVHAFTAHTNSGRLEPAHALAVHLEPNAMTVGEAGGWRDADDNVRHPPQDMGRINNMLKNPEHIGSLKKIGLMDFLTHNVDAHAHNLVVTPDGAPVSIDHGRSFFGDRKLAFGKEHIHDLEYEDGTTEMQATQDPEYHHEHFKTPQDLHSLSHAALEGGPPSQDTWDWWDKNKDAMRNRYIEHVNMLPDVNARGRMLQAFDSRLNKINKWRNDFAGHPAQTPVRSEVMQPSNNMAYAQTDKQRPAVSPGTVKGR